MKGIRVLKVSASILFFLASCILVTGGIQNTMEQTKIQQKQQLELELKRAIIECYALEGSYPPDIHYLESYYDIFISDEKYMIYYDIFASNIMPEFRVIEKN